MKKIISIVSTLFSLLLSSCFFRDYSRYYHAVSMKGTEIYCWQITKGVWRCGALPGTNAMKTLDVMLWMQNDLPCTLQKMKKIISTYPYETHGYIAVFDVPYPMTEESLFDLYSTNRGDYYNSENIEYLNWRLGLINNY